MRRLFACLTVACAAGAALADRAPADRLGPSEGVVLDIDRKEREITIRHGFLPELSMDAMSMVFVVADPVLLDRVKKGDRVKFKAGLVNGRFGVVSIDPVRARARK
ncbi:MAG: copper-binding protein [Betaproteobacteria bacterium]